MSQEKRPTEKATRTNDGISSATPKSAGRAGRWQKMATILLLILALAGFRQWLNNTKSIHRVTCTRSVEERAAQILKNNPLIDGHDDLLFLIRSIYRNHISGEVFKRDFEGGGMRGHVDLPRIKKGKMGGAFWSAFVPCPEDGFNFDNENYAPIVKATYEQLDLFHRLSSLYPIFFTPSPNSISAKSAFASGRLISPAAIEGLHQIGNSIAHLRNYFELGVRYATLTWNCHNKFADAALVSDESGETVTSTPYWHGVSSAGRDLIREMNRLGMIVDLSHVSKETMVDVLGGSEMVKGWNGSAAPPIFSHSSAYALCPHPRNVPDDVLQLVKTRDSLVMVNIAPEFISCTASNSSTGLPDFYPPNNTISHVVEHIKYIGELIGYDHVGIGTDFDGIASTPTGLEDVSKFPDLVATMLRHGISDEDVAKVVGRNLLRVWSAVDDVSMNLRKQTPPLEDDLQFLEEATGIRDDLLPLS